MLEMVRLDLGIAIAPEHLAEGQKGLHALKIPELRESTIYLAALEYDIVPAEVAMVQQALMRS